jgi:tRNA pseudouridine13 synthase
MKDKHAVTTQWMSLPARQAKPVAEWQLPEGVSVLESSRHGNKLRTGHLLGNHFRIRIVGVEESALEGAKRIVEELRARGLPNYFGAQRFGHGGRNLGDALAWLGASGGRRRLKPFERKLFASVVQSEIFNRYATARLGEPLERPLEGEVVRLHGSGAVFVVEDAEKETSRFSARDIHPTGPMIGPKMRAARGRALALEEAAVASVGLGDEARRELARHADGTRRDLLVHLDEVTLRPSDEQDQEENPNAVRSTAAPPPLVIGFFLPSGSYATQLVRELTREPFFRYTA